MRVSLVRFLVSPPLFNRPLLGAVSLYPPLVLTINDILAAADRIAPYVVRTPVLQREELDAAVGSRVWFKAEHRQPIKAFKIRGATNAILALPEDVASRGVVTHSSGNHAAAVAFAAKLRGIPAYIVMPTNVPASKRANVLAHGGIIVDCEPTIDSREAGAAQVLAERGGTLIHPYNDYDVMAGQGTAALELVEEHSDLDLILCPVGGGGLLSGTAVSTKARIPHARVIGVEPAAADDAARSFRSGKLVRPDAPPQTVADGLRGALGDLTFAEIRRHVDEIVTVDEDQIHEARILLERAFGESIEPSAAVPFAALLYRREAMPAAARVGVILTGGNVG